MILSPSCSLLGFSSRYFSRIGAVIGLAPTLRMTLSGEAAGVAPDATAVHGHRGALQDEAVPRRGLGHDEAGRVLRCLLQERAPAQGRVGDDRQAQGLG